MTCSSLSRSPRVSFPCPHPSFSLKLMLIRKNGEKMLTRIALAECGNLLLMKFMEITSKFSASTKSVAVKILINEFYRWAFFFFLRSVRDLKLLRVVYGIMLLLQFTKQHHHNLHQNNFTPHRKCTSERVSGNENENVEASLIAPCSSRSCHNIKYKLPYQILNFFFVILRAFWVMTRLNALVSSSCDWALQCFVHVTPWSQTMRAPAN